MVGVDPGGGDGGAPTPRRRRLLGRRATPATASHGRLAAGVAIAAALRDGLAAPAASGPPAGCAQLLDADARLPGRPGRRAHVGRARCHGRRAGRRGPAHGPPSRRGRRRSPCRCTSATSRPGVLVVVGRGARRRGPEGGGVGRRRPAPRPAGVVGRRRGAGRAARPAGGDLAALRLQRAHRRSPRSCAPTPTAPATCCSTSPSTSGTTWPGTASTRRWPGEFRAVEAYLALARAVLGERLRRAGAHRAGGAAGRDPVPRAAAAGGERRAARRRAHGGRRVGAGQRRGAGRGLRDRRGGRRAGHAPERARDVLAGRGTGTSLGLVNVDRAAAGGVRRRVRPRDRDRAGRGHPGVVRVPRFHPGVVAS